MKRTVVLLLPLLLTLLGIVLLGQISQWLRTPAELGTTCLVYVLLSGCCCGFLQGYSRAAHCYRAALCAIALFAAVHLAILGSLLPQLLLPVPVLLPVLTFALPCLLAAPWGAGFCRARARLRQEAEAADALAE